MRFEKKLEPSNFEKFKEIEDSVETTAFGSETVILGSKSIIEELVALFEEFHKMVSSNPLLWDAIANDYTTVEKSLNTLKLKSENAAQLVLSQRPNFLYFDDIDRLPDSISMSKFVEDSSLSGTFQNLIALAGLDITRLVNLEPLERQREVDEASATITGHISGAWRQEEVEIRFGIDADNLFVYVIDETGNQVRPSSRSKGFQWFLAFYINFQMGSQATFKDCVLLVDDPGVYLHPIGQRDLLQILGKIAQKNQIIYVTHSPFLIDRDNLEGIRIFEKEGNEGTIITSGFQKSESDALAPVRHAIGMTLGDTLFAKKNNIVVEGISDYFILDGFLHFLEKQEKISSIPKNLAIIPVGGANKIPYFVWLLWKDKHCYVVMLDFDDAGRAVKEELEETGLHGGKTLMLNEAVPLGDSANYEIEDLIESSLYNRAVNEVYSTSLTTPIELTDLGSEPSPRAEKYKRYLRKHKLELEKIRIAIHLRRMLRNDMITSGEVGEDTIRNFSTLFNLAFERLRREKG
ncbi:MAG: AAA family ATPase [Candidatus Hermodarchaeota archaeon]|nr:AAA family ATPase [Candidatus Hermodarchaeota archaeon]